MIKTLVIMIDVSYLLFLERLFLWKAVSTTCQNRPVV